MQRILAAGGARLRREGLGGASIASVMADAGLTHGAFYAHFRDKEELLAASFRQALEGNRSRWITRGQGESWPRRLARLAKRYLTPAHRDNLAGGCALASLVSEAGRGSDGFRRAYEEELKKSLQAICEAQNGHHQSGEKQLEEAVMLMALCVGGIALARAVKAKELSDGILRACQKAAGRLGSGHPETAAQGKSGSTVDPGPREKSEKSPKFSQFPVKTFDKMRYADTDRQGHVNNAVFATMLETGRVVILYDPEKPVAGPDCSFVLANQRIDFLSEITWPGRVEIGTRVSAVGRSSITLDQALFQDGRCAATARAVAVQVDQATRRSKPLNGQAVERLTALMSAASA